MLEFGDESKATTHAYSHTRARRVYLGHTEARERREDEIKLLSAHACEKQRESRMKSL